MQQRRYRHAALDSHPRTRVMSTWGLLGVTALVLALLAIVFPAGTLHRQLAQLDKPDPVAVQYLENMLREKPQDGALRLALARQQYELADPQTALATVAPLAADADAPLRRDALLLQYEILRTVAFAQADGTPMRAAATTRLRETLALLGREQWDTGALAPLAADAAAYGEADTAAVLYARLAARPDATPEMLARGALAMLGARDYRAAARLYFAARERETGLDARRDLFLEGVGALQSGNLLAEALAEADRHLGDLAGDDRTLMALARLALAANDTARAQRYARALMRMSAAHPAAPREPPPWLAALADLFISTARAQGGGALRAFDDDVYRLAFDVFVGGGKVDDAWRVAAEAVRQRPDDAAWRERLAQAAEWSGRPADALEQWTWLAQRGSTRATEGVLRLAPGLHADDALLAAWLGIARTRALTPAESRQLARLFETVGEPQQGVAFFNAQERRRPDAVNLEIIASLNERMGRVAEAIAAYESLAAAQPLTDAQALALTGLYMKRGDFTRAFETLAARRSARGDDADYWRLYGELAWTLQRDEAAGDAYTRLAARGEARAFEIQRLVMLLRADRPADAARLAEAGWLRLRDPQLLLAALDLYAGLGDGASQDRLLAALGEADAATFSSPPYLFVLRANRYAARGLVAQAEADFRRAVAAAPGDASIRAAQLWFLVEHGSRDALRGAIAAAAPLARTEASLAAPIAAGHLALDEPTAALAYLRRELPRRQNDYLWLLTYADALDADGQAGMADRVRRHAWQAVRAAAAQDPRRFERGEDLVAAARLALSQAPGDPAAAAIRLVLRQDSAPPAVDRPVAARAQDAAARELVLAWSLTLETNDAARAWMWRAYGRRLAAPAWAQAVLALEEGDHEAMERLLADARTPAATRIELARELGWYRTAQSLGFAAADRRPHDDAIADGLSEDLRRTAPSLVLRETGFDYRPIRGLNTFAAVPLWINEKLRIAPVYSLTHQSSTSQETLTNVPSRDQYAGVAVLWREQRQQAEVVLGRREAVEGFNTAMLLYGRDFGGRLRADARLGWNDRAFDTSALFVGGMKNEVRLALQYDLSKREYVNAGAALQRFYTQAGTRLGSGDRVEAEIGHRFRTEYPDLTLRGYAAHQSYRPGSTSDEAVGARLNPGGTVPPATFFLPQSFSYYSAAIGFGEYLRGQPFAWDRFGEQPYSKALRPFASAGLGYNTVSGSGPNFLLGVAGRLLGHDQFAFYYLQSNGGTGTFTRASELVLRYQYFF